MLIFDFYIAKISGNDILSLRASCEISIADFP